MYAGGVDSEMGTTRAERVPGQLTRANGAAVNLSVCFFLSPLHEVFHDSFLCFLHWCYIGVANIWSWIRRRKKKKVWSSFCADCSQWLWIWVNAFWLSCRGSLNDRGARKSQATAQCKPRSATVTYRPCNTAVRRDFIWEQGGMDEPADLERPISIFDRHGGCSVFPAEVTSHVMVNSWEPPPQPPLFQRVMEQGDSEEFTRRAPPTIPTVLQPVTAARHHNMHTCMVM